MDKITIEPELLEGFRNLKEFSDLEPETADQADPADPPIQKNHDKITLKALGKSLEWITGTADQYLKNNDLAGIGDLDPKQLSELISIVLERNVSSAFLQKSPEIMLGTVLSGIAVQNMIQYQKNQKAKKEVLKNDSEN